MVVRWGLNLAATKIFGTVEHWPATLMQGVHANEPRDEERPANGLRSEGKVALNRRYIGSVYKFYRWMYEGSASRANIEATMAELYEFARPSFTGEVIGTEQVIPFSRGDNYLKNLWHNEVEVDIPFRIEMEENDKRDPIVMRMWRII